MGRLWRSGLILNLPNNLNLQRDWKSIPKKDKKKTTTGTRKPRRGRNTNEHQVTKKRG